MSIGIKFVLLLVIMTAAEGFIGRGHRRSGSRLRWCRRRYPEATLRQIRFWPPPMRRRCHVRVIRPTVTARPPQTAQGPVSKKLMSAIQFVETGDECEKKDPCPVLGDGGRALGPYQIHRAYYQDAKQKQPELASRPYEDVAYNGFAQKIVQAYMSRYATSQRLERTPTDEDIARIHNGGPNGYKKSSTIKYWIKVRARLMQLRWRPG